MTPILEVEQLSRRFGGLAAVNDVSFSLGEAEVLAVIGPNGAGKSTLINLITGHVKPTSGRVVIGGRDVTGARPWSIADAEVARTFQMSSRSASSTCARTWRSARCSDPRAPDRRARRARADEVLERVGLAEQADAEPGGLNVADARRLELAKALAMRPRLLLLDEVMAGLRPREIETALELIRSLKDEEMTILVVEHVMKAILSVSDTVLVMHEGEELVHGEPQKVMEDERVIEAYLGQRYAKRMRARREEGRDA